MVKRLRLVVPVGRGRPPFPCPGRPLINAVEGRPAGAAGEVWQCLPRLLPARSWQAAESLSTTYLIIADAPSAGSQNQRTIRRNGNSVLSVCASRAVPAP
jgi:hypothetical protein